MEAKKVIETIEKKLGVVVEEQYEMTQEGKVVFADVKVGEKDYRKILLKEMKNQYGPYYKIVSEEKYDRRLVPMPGIEKLEERKKEVSRKPRTKTEKLCGGTRKEIISFAETEIECVANGTASIKEIEGAAKDDTVIRFVLLLNTDGSRFKEDIEIKKIREALEA